MEFATEPYVPELSSDIELGRHHRYMMALDLAKGKEVLEIASDEGYGSAMLAAVAVNVIGVGLSGEAVDRARSRYQAINLQFVKGDCANIPLPNSSIDLVVSFETIEHHDEHRQMMKEIKRVLRPSGVLLISSPDRFNYSVHPNYKNPHHVKELFEQDFKALMESFFEHCAYYGQRVLSGSAIISEGRSTDFDDYCCGKDGKANQFRSLYRPIYRIALASDAAVPAASSGFYEPYDFNARRDSIIADRDAEASRLNAEVSELKRRLRKNEVERYRAQIESSAILLQRDRQIEEANAALSAQKQEKNRTEAEFAERLEKLALEVATQRIEIAEKNQAIAAIWGSRSMRLTKPLRAIATLLHRIRRRQGPMHHNGDHGS